VAGFAVSVPEAPPKHEGLPVWRSDSLPYGPNECRLVAAIVSNRRRTFVEDLLARGYSFATVVHPSATISRRSSLSDGCVVNAGVVISQNTVVEPHVIMNRGCLIGHDNRIGAFTTVGPGANLAGALSIGEGVYIGVGAVVRDHLSIGPGAVIGAGAVAVKSVPDHCLATGVPAVVTRTDVDGL
jgi:sugar O-acyltransferase (sialic acid O-acetyltransferase NeuD family)